jgi:hypothetical protein
MDLFGRPVHCGKKGAGCFAVEMGFELIKSNPQQAQAGSTNKKSIKN